MDYDPIFGNNTPNVFRTKVSRYHNGSYFLNGLLKEEYSTKGNDTTKIFSRTINTYEVKKLNDSNQEINIASIVPNTFDVGGTEGRRTAAVLLTKTVNQLYELDTTPQITSQVEYVYDNKGRIIEYKNIGNSATTSDDYNSIIDYHNDSSLLNLNIINIPKSITVSFNGGIIRKRITEVDNTTGKINRIKAYLNNNEYALTQMEYYPNGNLHQIIFPENSQNVSLSYTYEYDLDYGKYITSIHNDAFGFSSSALYDGNFDKIVKTIDIAGNTMNYEYDSFGRNTIIRAPKEKDQGVPYTIKFSYFPKFEDLPNNSGVTYDLANLENSTFVPVALTQHYDQQHPENDIETYTFIDGLARPIQIKKDISLNSDQTHENEDYTEALSITGKIFYDNYGRETRQYHPYYEIKSDVTKYLLNEYNSQDVQYTEYDELDRPTHFIDADGKSSTMQYSIANDVTGTTAIKTKSILDQNGSQSVITETYKDIYGKVISTKNEGPLGEIWTKFLYDQIGQLERYTDAENLSTSYKYDMLGRKIEINNPDKGTTNYQYDFSGNLTNLRTANLNSTGSSISYIYDYNRLINIIFPENSDGTLNISNVEYQYDSFGRLVHRQDATGYQSFDYGNMNEIVADTRVVVTPSLSTPIRTFTSFYKYDSWNRMMSMTYPDNEEVTFQYDLGGNLNKMSGMVNGNPYDYIQRIDYDYYEQRAFLMYGNTTKTYYNYTPELRRLNNLQVKTSDGNDLFNNNYTYDYVGNILNMNNSAAISTNGIGGSYEHTFSYDTLNRLAEASGSFTGDQSQQLIGNDWEAKYNLSMNYNDTNGIMVKTQKHEKNGITFEPNDYSGTYAYFSNTHKVESIDYGSNNITNFSYDQNGNAVKINNQEENMFRRLFWDESDRLRVVNDNDTSLQHYIYDASGERILKANSDVAANEQNGTVLNPASITINSYTTYPSAYLVIDGQGVYSKHYFAGSQRIISRIGESDISIFGDDNDGPMTMEPSGKN